MSFDAQSFALHTKEAVASQINYAKEVGIDAVASQAWLYPLQGIIYFISHRTLWIVLGKVFVRAMLISLAVLLFMFTFTYIPQAAALCMIQMGPLGFISAVPLVLSESSFIINQLLKIFVLGDRTVLVFDAVLVNSGHGQLVEKGREIKGSSKGKIIGKMVTKPLERFSPSALGYYILTLPLQFIPIVGPAVFFVLNGAKTGPSMHARYFQLKGFSEQQRKHFIYRHRGAYTALGTVCLLLNTIPLASVVFDFTNTCGAALFASQLEKEIAKDLPAEQKEDVKISASDA